MRVLLKTNYASPSGLTGNAGQAITVPDEEGAALIEGGYADATGGVAEAAIATGGETADLNPGKPKRGAGKAKLADETAASGTVTADK